ncbi:UrcA family protein [Novosphingobium lentum]|uniref:UrcA family protein n=1 Tax=Novosphingobium lentum TaxID=145287 RepID=UPI00082FA3C4|nr:UrcA family protein [Novosphingobium lentum]
MTKLSFARPALIIATAMIASISVPVAAQSADAVEHTQVQVKFDGVDVSSDAGVATLRGKIRRAAEQACRPDGNTPQEIRLNKSCLRTSIAQGDAQIDAMHRQALANNGEARSLAANTSPASPTTR